MQIVMLLIILVLLLLLIYALLIYYYRKWFNKIQLFNPDAIVVPVTYFSIIIPARNEEEIIGKCLKSIFENDYPSLSFEVIVVDDYSTDKTAEVVEALQPQHCNLKLIKLAEVLKGELNSYKKKAIEIAI